MKQPTQEQIDVARDCADLADRVSNDYWRLYKHGSTDARGDPHYQGMADGAANVAVAIRNKYGLKEDDPI